ncbi:MAG: DUF1573 domain-containing protein [candidate division Zixibacteria bacterium]|nr:DUF1573 domain-containing protein [candidate division Zixibacteria bacterium]
MRLLIVAIFTMCLIGLGGVAQAGPMIEIPNPVFNWGKVCQKATVSHTFWIKSVGDDTLRILKVVPGCGCTKAPLQDSVLAPGDSTRLDIFLSTKSYRGYLTKRPYLETNISEEKIYLKIISHLITDPELDLPLFIQPQRVDVSQFTIKPRRKAKFLIENRGDQDYQITPIDWAVDYFDVELPSVVKAGETAEGRIIVHEDKVPSQFELSLTFAIDDDSESRYTIPVKRVFRIKKGAASEGK